LAGEDGLTSAIIAGDMPTRSALLACMLGVHHDHRHTGQSRFVLDEAAELRKSPAGHTSPLRLPERSPRADAFEVFAGDPTPSVCSSRNDPFADAVIHSTAKGGFPPRRALQGTTDVLGALAGQVTEVCGPL